MSSQDDVSNYDHITIDLVCSPVAADFVLAELRSTFQTPFRTNHLLTLSEMLEHMVLSGVVAENVSGWVSDVKPRAAGCMFVIRVRSGNARS
jgi:hypothetical protein